MCGFGGVINSLSVVDRKVITDIAKSVSHRGPDYTGIALFNELCEPSDASTANAFFFNRLAIIDPDDRSNQPFQNERYLLLFNGEIYNYKALRHELKTRGAIFKTSSDTEVLFLALQFWGREALKKLNGMFAFFWLDRKEQSFILARDRTGIKPLYYKIEDGTLIFASELKSVVRLSNRACDISSQSIQNYLCLQYVPTPYSIIQDIYKLPPGHFIAGSIHDLKSNKALTTEPFWDAYHFIKSENIQEQDKCLEQILVESINLQLQADVPLGLFLSSGVDSSLLTALINKHFKGRYFDFFTVGFDEETTSDESGQALNYLNGFQNPNLRHHKLSLHPSTISSKLDILYDYFDEPFGDPAALLNWAISEKARDHVTVALSGDGADELFWGYPRYNEWKEQSGRTYKKIRHLSAAKSLFNLLPEGRIRYTLLNMLESDPAAIHFNILRPRLFGFMPPVESKKFLWCLNGLGKLKTRKDLSSIIDIKAYLADAMLYKVDRASMASSLEVRVPYLDNNVINYALKLPLSEKSTTEYKFKAPLKKLLTQLAPHYNIHQPKKGFNFPLNNWLKDKWKAMVMDTITPNCLAELGLPPAPFLRIVDRFYSKNENNLNEVWYLLNLILWHNTFKSNTIKRKG